MDSKSSRMDQYKQKKSPVPDHEHEQQGIGDDGLYTFSGDSNNSSSNQAMIQGNFMFNQSFNQYFQSYVHVGNGTFIPYQMQLQPYIINGNIPNQVGNYVECGTEAQLQSNSSVLENLSSFIGSTLERHPAVQSHGQSSTRSGGTGSASSGAININHFIPIVKQNDFRNNLSIRNPLLDVTNNVMKQKSEHHGNVATGNMTMQTHHNGTYAAHVSSNCIASGREMTKTSTNTNTVKSNKTDITIQRSNPTNGINFESLSNQYPPNLNQKVKSVVSSMSDSSCPETIPTTSTEESNEQEFNKRRRVSQESTSSCESNLDILCQAATIAASKSEEEDSRKHLSAIESVLRKKSCNCPKSRCIKLYCECFQEGRLCTPGWCFCKSCLNTQKETGLEGMRTKAIKTILARNPHAFSKDKAPSRPPPTHDGIVCRCVKSRCLKLYCECFQSGQLCDEFCLCIKCLNTKEESKELGKRTLAVRVCLRRNADAFQKKDTILGYCSCKFSRCLKKYCECFRIGISCSSNCKCEKCENVSMGTMKEKRAVTVKKKSQIKSR